MTAPSLPQAGDLLKHQYKILELIATESPIPRYRAQDQETLQSVLLLAFPFDTSIKPRKIQSLENELDFLLTLKAPTIATYYCHFRQESPQGTTVYLVQQDSTASTLTELITRGWKPSEKTVRKIGEELCAALVYLHNLNPPLAHQSINPDTILRQNNGKLVLTDFGLIQDAYLKAIGQVSASNRTGYEAPDQLDHDQHLSNDLFSLGLTLLFLLIGSPPPELPTHYQKIWFRESLNLSPSFQDWLERLIEPTIANRFPRAEDALAALLPEPSQPNLGPDKVPFCPILFQKKGNKYSLGLSPLWIASGGTHLLFGVILLILLQPALRWTVACINASMLFSQISFESNPCTNPATRKELKENLTLQVSGTASREEIALGLVKVGKSLIPKDYACAEGSLHEAIRIDPSLAVAHNNLGIVKYQQQDYKAAIAAFQQALHLNPGYGEANANLGRTLETNGSMQEAMAVYGNVQPKPLQPVHKMLSLVLNTSGERYNKDTILSSAERLMAYRQVLKQHPNSPEVHYYIGLALDTQGELDAAIAEYLTAIQLKPKLAEAHGNLANAYAIQGKRIEAYSHFQTAIALFRAQNRTSDVQKTAELMRHFQFL